ncbi:50S ribosomal protein L24 [Colletotrichum sojae]|uniref:Large ribosomal subunit protein bL28m n=1 Tax=Colletotrichum sojae TaxID=2175907 RepID=A0A8H6JDX8_9PEZI|nr:50S ribosomal protein L24 [Colletotrichum sojae]
MRLNPLRPGSSLTTAFSSLTLGPSSRTFSTSSPLAAKTIKIKAIPKLYAPAYPLGDRQHYKQSNRNLLGTARIRTGNVISEKHHQVSKRTWKPNVHNKRLFSEHLGAWIHTRVTIRVLRTIRKEGGLDNYLLKDKPARVAELGPGGWRLRWLVQQTQGYRERFAAEAASLKMPLGEAVMPPDNSALIPLMLDAATPGGLKQWTTRILHRKRKEEARKTSASVEKRRMKRALEVKYALLGGDPAAQAEAAIEAAKPKEEQAEAVWEDVHIDGVKTQEAKL